MSSALLCNGSHAVDPLGRSHSLETRYDKEGMLGLHSPLSKGPRSTPKQYHAPAPMLGALLCNGSHTMDLPRRSHSLETRLDRGGTLSVCRSTKTQVNPSSALNRTKHHQSNPSNVPGILDSILYKRVCVYTSKSLLTWSNRILPL